MYQNDLDFHYVDRVSRVRNEIAEVKSGEGWDQNILLEGTTPQKMCILVVLMYRFKSLVWENMPWLRLPVKASWTFIWRQWREVAGTSVTDACMFRF